ncbi:MAG: hypothetical protein L6282_10455, partial [Candidatus Methanoperedenaceae archaeon]|nr:hypothetical protein [Candidatus Methanoperedenaceae archaeon]
ASGGKEKEEGLLCNPSILFLESKELEIAHSPGSNPGRRTAFFFSQGEKKNDWRKRKERRGCQRQPPSSLS